MTENEAKEAAAVTPTKSLFGGVSRPVEVEAKDVDEKLVEATGPAALEPIHANVEDVAQVQASLQAVEDKAEAERVEATSVSEDNVVERTDGTQEGAEKHTPSEGQVDLENPTEAASNGTVDGAAENTTGSETAEPTKSEDAPIVSDAVEEAVVETPAKPVVEAVPDTKTAPVAKATPTEGDTETVTELYAKKLALDDKLTAKQKKEWPHVISQIAAVVKTYAIPVKVLADALGGIPSPRKGIPAPILYRDANGNAWSGRGKLPKWLKDKNPDDFKV